ncbi:Serine/threonine protein phosphatase PrpC [Amycolatopsis sacchari]|uniref:Serine/threonine protein phosphatase PrpC n=1 Tax=Amycolatopsis sacchari TaxID=115433 RepID=A0A1I3M0E1_9PSEU|nr:Serine/threonine protein phosphatase PrpC [Amycolatopsis sacchari]
MLRGSAKLWQHEETGFAAVGVCTERIAERGEDADPLLLFHRPTRHGLLAVFDGVGGAGRGTAGRAGTGLDRTQAWVASRRVRGLVEEWFTTDRTGDLRERIVARLAAGTRRGSRVRGSIAREFPSTFAGLAFQLGETGVRWEVLWAGDSRCYVAEPTLGLQQLSRDDTDSADALELLVQDPPMTNMVSASRDFQLNRWQGSTLRPCLLVCATDGFFGYVDTPAEFEYLLWDTLLSAQEITHWSALLAERVTAYTGDDASLVVAALGFRTFDELRASFRTRRDLLHTEHAEPMRLAREHGRAALVPARERSWRLYRRLYERRLPGAEGEVR